MNNNIGMGRRMRPGIFRKCAGVSQAGRQCGCSMMRSKGTMRLFNDVVHQLCHSKILVLCWVLCRVLCWVRLSSAEHATAAPLHCCPVLAAAARGPASAALCSLRHQAESQRGHSKVRLPVLACRALAGQLHPARSAPVAGLGYGQHKLSGLLLWGSPLPAHRACCARRAQRGVLHRVHAAPAAACQLAGKHAPPARCRRSGPQ